MQRLTTILPRWTLAGGAPATRRHRALLIGLFGLLGAVLLAAGLVFAPPVAAKSFALTGIIDCGTKNGKDCDIGDTVVIWTADVSGTNERVTVDVSWIKELIDDEGFEQDDRICLEVDDANGKLQATGLILTCDLQGTDNPGRSTRSRTAKEQEKPPQDDDAKSPTPNQSSDLLDRIRALPCNNVTGGFECPIPEDILREANAAGLRIVFNNLPPNCAVILRTRGASIICST